VNWSGGTFRPERRLGERSEIGRRKAVHGQHCPQAGKRRISRQNDRQIDGSIGITKNPFCGANYPYMDSMVIITLSSVATLRFSATGRDTDVDSADGTPMIATAHFRYSMVDIDPVCRFRAIRATER
jgi:hypothetical protein